MGHGRGHVEQHFVREKRVLAKVMRVLMHDGHVVSVTAGRITFMRCAQAHVCQIGQRLLLVVQQRQNSDVTLRK